MNKGTFWTGIVLLIVAIIRIFLYGINQMYWILTGLIGIVAIIVGLIMKPNKNRNIKKSNLIRKK